MKIGNFFKIDNNSKFDDGIVYYRYLRIYRKENKGGESDYPVYLSISSSAITFYIQKREENFKIYKHSELFHIPLSVNLRAKKNIENIFKNIYEANITELEEKNDFNKSNTYAKDDAKDTYSDSNLIQSKKDLKDSKYLLSFRELILDFLFDVEHCRVFRSSSLYKKMKESLTSDPFFVALSAKYDFYYKRKTLINHTGENSPVSKKLYNDYYKAHNQWLDIICEPGMGSIICENNKWFDEIEKEHKNVLFYRQINLIYTQKKEKGKKKEKEICKIVVDGEEKAIIEAVNRADTIDNFQKSGNWLIRRYDLINALRLSRIGTKRNQWLLSIPILLYIVAYILCCRMFCYTDLTFEFDWGFFFLNIFLIIPSFVIVTLIILLIIGWCRGIRLTGLLLPRILMAIFTAWFAIALITENWLISFDINLFNRKTIWTIIGLSIIVLGFMLNEIKGIARGLNIWRLLYRIGVIFIVALSYSLVVGTTTSSYVAKKLMLRQNIAHEFWDKDNGKKFNNYAPINKELGQNPNDATFNHDFESLSYLNSHRLGDEEAKHKILYKYEIGEFNLYIFPGMLLVSAFIAMFVGIFLQLIFEDKPITEPL